MNPIALEKEVPWRFLRGRYWRVPWRGLLNLAVGLLYVILRAELVLKQEPGKRDLRRHEFENLEARLNCPPPKIF